MTNQAPEPIRLPDPVSEPPRSEGVIEVNRSTLYYMMTAALFFVAGYIVAWAVFSSTTGGLISDMKSAAASAASDAVGTAVAKMPQGQAVAIQPTATPVPNQVIDEGNYPSWGPADAKVTVVEFSDFECPYCEVFFRQTYPLLKQRYGDKIRFVYRDFPLSQHPNALPAALAAQCANEQGKFWEYHDLLFNNQAIFADATYTNFAQQLGLDTTKFNECYKSQKYMKSIQDNLIAGQKYFVGGTPTFFINGQYFEGARSLTAFMKVIDPILTNAASGQAS